MFPQESPIDVMNARLSDINRMLRDDTPFSKRELSEKEKEQIAEIQFKIELLEVQSDSMRAEITRLRRDREYAVEVIRNMVSCLLAGIPDGIDLSSVKMRDNCIQIASLILDKEVAQKT